MIYDKPMTYDELVKAFPVGTRIRWEKDSIWCEGTVQRITNHPQIVYLREKCSPGLTLVMREEGYIMCGYGIKISILDNIKPKPKIDWFAINAESAGRKS